ncbi:MULTISPECIES: hypothetical protein [unclassified Chryseobacterium]|uniref:hypothetical protein n=1 Tax=unclassified Chryseobacterium TaxID=2593645 RepID=UPI00226A4AC6|nr:MULTISPECIES: hypothetical protein [unclassified Chryseobacterium]
MNILEKIENNYFFKFFNNNNAMLIAVPTIIGGIKQFLEISYISTDLIKFFSLSQLIIDGLIATIKLLFVYFILFVYKDIVQSRMNEEKSYTLRYKWLKKYIIKLSVLFFLTNALVIYLYYINIDRYLLKILTIPFILVTYCLWVTLVFLGKFRSKITKTVTFIGIGFITIFVQIKDVNKIENFNDLSNSVRQKYPKAKIAFYNDQYIFFATNPSYANTSIVVKKIDDLFPDDKNSK